MYLSTSGALGQNMYLAISPDSQPISWTQGVTSLHNGTEFAMQACKFDESGETVSGIGNDIECFI